MNALYTMMGSRLMELRTMRGVSVIDLSSVLNTTPDEIIRYEAGERIPAQRLLEISAALKIAVDVLFTMPRSFEADPPTKPTPAESFELVKIFTGISSAQLRSHLIEIADYMRYSPSR